MSDTIVGSVGLLVGCLLIVFRNAFAHLTINFQNSIMRSNFGEKEIRMTKIIAVGVGIGFVAMGILAIMWTIHFR